MPEVVFHMGGGRRNCLTTPGHSFIHVGKSEIRSLSHIVHKNVCVCVCVYVSHSVLSDSMQPHGLWPTRLLCPWDSPGKNTGVGFHSLLQGIFPNPGIKPRSLTFQADSLPPEPPGKPTQECILEELGLKSEKAKLQNV